MPSVLPTFPEFLPFALAAMFLLVAALAVLVIFTQAEGIRRYIPLALTVGGFLSFAVAFSKFTIDDTYIALRFAHNFARGYGLVYSYDGSPPVEGYTDFLWVVLEAPLTLMRSEAAIIAGVKILGVLSGVAAVLLTFLLTRRLGGDTTTASIASLLLGSSACFAFWAVGGLETLLYVAFILAALVLLINALRTGRKPWLAGVVFALATLTRPEGLLLSAVALTLGIWLELRSTPVRTRILNVLAGLGGFAIVYAPYYAWRYSYYGYPLPNTFYGKTTASSFEWVWPRIVGLWPFMVTTLPLLLFAIVLLKNRQFSKPGWQVFSVVGFAAALASLAATREWMPGFRYEVPVIPFVVIIAAFGITSLAERFEPRRRQIVIGVAVMASIVLLATPAVWLRNSLRYTDGLAAAHIKVGQWLHEYAPEGSSFAGWDGGAIPYFSDLPRFIEIHPEGILSNEIAHGTYDVDSMLADFIALPLDDGGTSGLSSFYRNTQFQSDYKLLFEVALRRDYIVRLFGRRDIDLDAEALVDGQRLQQASFSRVDL